MSQQPSSQPSAGYVVDLAHVIAVAQRAGDLILAMRAQGLRQIHNKSTEIDLVTEADIASEKLIRSELQQLYPAIDLWGEESNKPPNSELFWIVDPIDGTTNFANGLPYYAVNIALNRRETTLLGVTLELPARRLYFAKLGEGATVRQPDGRETRLRVSQVGTLNGGMLSTGFPYHRGEHADNNLAEFGYFLARAQGVRAMGSAAMDLINVAEGALIGYWEGWLKAWDAAPGVLFVREAGGRVTDYRGVEWQISSHTLIASNGNSNIHQAMIDGIRQARQALPTSLLPADEMA